MLLRKSYVFMKPDLVLYRGYANEHHLVVFGHVSLHSAPDKYPMDKKGIKHALAIIRAFNVQPVFNADVRLRFRGLDIRTKTLADGYFRFDVPFYEKLESGWHPYSVTCSFNGTERTEEGELLKPFASKLGIISDIDDTFLVSHTSNIFRKLYVLLYRNAERRKVFEDVADHYRLLSLAGQEGGAFNSFFYVSSSEWNLYHLIRQVTDREGLPKAVMKLRDIKTGIGDFLFRGHSDHNHKFYKIKDVISFYPGLRYVLLGDDTQHDPVIYEKIGKIFPGSILAVYIRQSGERKEAKTERILNNMETLNIATCYFKHSEQAIEHSRSIGII